MLAAAVSFVVGAPPNLNHQVKTALVATDHDPTKKMHVVLADATLQTSSGTTGDKMNGLHGYAAPPRAVRSLPRHCRRHCRPTDCAHRLTLSVALSRFPCAQARAAVCADARERQHV